MSIQVGDLYFFEKYGKVISVKKIVTNNIILGRNKEDFADKYFGIKLLSKMTRLDELMVLNDFLKDSFLARTYLIPFYQKASIQIYSYKSHVDGLYYLISVDSHMNAVQLDATIPKEEIKNYVFIATRTK